MVYMYMYICTQFSKIMCVYTVEYYFLKDMHTHTYIQNYYWVLITMKLIMTLYTIRSNPQSHLNRVVVTYNLFLYT